MLITREALLSCIKERRSFISEILRLVSLVVNSLSSSLVIRTFTSWFSSKFFRSNAIWRLISFSKVPVTPTFPGSLPPCPASMTMVGEAGENEFIVKLSLEKILFEDVELKVSEEDRVV